MLTHCAPDGEKAISMYNSFSTVVVTGVLVFSISSCVTAVRHLRGRVFGKWGVFLATKYASEQSANLVEYGNY